MKMRLLSLLFLVCSICGYAQVKLTVQGGAGMSGITKAYDYSPKVGYRFGVGVELPFNSQWALQTGLQVLNRHYGIDEFYSNLVTEGNDRYVKGVDIDGSINAVYLQLPIKAVYVLPINGRSALRLGGGVYVAYGIAGETNSTVDWYSSSYVTNGTLAGSSYDTSHTSYTTSFGTFSENGLKKFDMGLSLGLDYSYRNIFVGIGFEYGILSISKDFVEDATSIVNGDVRTVSPPKYRV
ncbi:MAG: PorT family protein [Bacteroides sp.]|nr:PorT family protein [Bacteroides sp.]